MSIPVKGGLKMIEKLEEAIISLEYHSYYDEARAIKEAIEVLKQKENDEDRLNKLINEIKGILKEFKPLEKSQTLEFQRLIKRIEELVPIEELTIQVNQEVLSRFKEQYKKGNDSEKRLIINMMKSMGLSEQQIKKVTG